MKHPQLQSLGDLLGSLSYFGQCPKCGRQHMSTHDLVYMDPVYPYVIYCAMCPPKGVK